MRPALTLPCPFLQFCGRHHIPLLQLLRASYLRGLPSGLFRVSTPAGTCPGRRGAPGGLGLVAELPGFRPLPRVGGLQAPPRGCQRNRAFCFALLCTGMVRYVGPPCSWCTRRCRCRLGQELEEAHAGYI